MLAGRVQLLFDAVAIPAIREGRLVALATNAETRNPLVPDVPTLRELGLQRAETVAWFGIAAPAGLPAPILTRLVAALEKVMQMPEVAQQMAPMGLVPSFEAGEAFANRIRTDRARYGEAVRQTGAERG
jgi:tripartite-type tricarboxylate transporter receptor subunit TctC